MEKTTHSFYALLSKKFTPKLRIVLSRKKKSLLSNRLFFLVGWYFIVRLEQTDGSLNPNPHGGGGGGQILPNRMIYKQVEIAFEAARK